MLIEKNRLSQIRNINKMVYDIKVDDEDINLVKRKVEKLFNLNLYKKMEIDHNCLNEKGKQKLKELKQIDEKEEIGKILMILDKKVLSDEQENKTILQKLILNIKKLEIA